MRSDEEIISTLEAAQRWTVASSHDIRAISPTAIYHPTYVSYDQFPAKLRRMARVGFTPVVVSDVAVVATTLGIQRQGTVGALPGSRRPGCLVVAG